jgi:hypothetical protein
MATPRKGKAKVKITASGKKVSYGQAGKAKGGGPRVKPGTSNKTTLTLPTIYQEKDGNVLEQNLRESNGY